MEDRPELETYKALVARHPELQIRGKKMPYTAMNGNMFTFLSPEGEICVRLGTADTVEFESQFGPHPVVQDNAVMREYVSLPEGMKDDEAADWMRRSVVHAQSLKPKPTTRKKAGK